MAKSAAKAQSARALDMRGPIGWLGLAASPTFALMALVTASDPAAMALCSAGSAVLPVGGMPAMYLLMSLFHLPPWLKLGAPKGRSLMTPEGD